MAMFSIHHPWVFIFGILGNIISFMVYLAPVPTFYRVIKKKSTEGFQSVPYLFALFSSMLWIYYASVKSNACLLITINSFGCVIETIYIAIYIAYAPKKARMMTLKLLFFLNFGGFCLIVLISHFLVKPANQAKVLGWICLIFSVCVFAAPLTIMTKVIRTKSVEFMPFWLSFFLALSAIMWFFYGLLQRDFFVTLPNVLGFAFGVVQMILYVIYKNCNQATEKQKLPTNMKPTTTMTPEVYPVCSLPICDQNRDVVRDQTQCGQTGTHEESRDTSNHV